MSATVISLSERRRTRFVHLWFRLAVAAYYAGRVDHDTYLAALLDMQHELAAHREREAAA